MKKGKDLWLIVWYDCDEEDDDGNITYDNPNNYPYRISCAYVEDVWADWKYITFPNRAGKTESWKRSSWSSRVYPLDHEFGRIEGDHNWYDLAVTKKGMAEFVEKVKVSDLVDLTPYLIADGQEEEEAARAAINKKLKTIKKWRKRYETRM